MGMELSKGLGIPVTITNRPGAGGSLGTQSVIRAANDGYTLLYAQNSALTIRRVIDPQNANYDPLTDLLPLALTTRSPSVLVVHKDAPFKTIEEMVSHAKQSLNGLRVGNAGPGSVGEISVLLMKEATGASFESINYKGAAPAVTDLLGRHIDAVILALGAVSSFIEEGTLRALTISSPLHAFRNVPTLRQLGYKADLLGVWFGFFMPVGVPKNIVESFLPALESAARNPSVAAQLLPAGIVQEWGSGQALSEEISKEYRAISNLLGPASKKTVK
ncbi:hypothetical protein GCM10007242_27630 [Pigmentiphaga litoralis]|nr:hypothetical protein GCM10007242_27630 [Pigmentiphaga litoralis]